MMQWPSLELTEYERKFVRIYKTSKDPKDGKSYPGVLPRIYNVVLNSLADSDQNLPVIKLSGQIQISRRSRVFGLTFTGRLDSWRLQIITASGTSFTQKTPRSQLDPFVSAMVPGTSGNSLSTGGVPFIDIGAATPSDGVGPNTGVVPWAQTVNIPFPLIIDPNWLLMPNETLIFNGTPQPAIYSADDGVTFKVPMLTLSVGIHVWEFPNM